MPDRPTVPEAELRWRFSRSSGPGGQGVNTADSRVELLWDVARSPSLTQAQRARIFERLSHRIVDGVLVVAASEQRSQLDNRRLALQRLRALVDEALAPPPPRRRPTRPTRASGERRLSDKRRRAEVKRLRGRAHGE